MIDMRSDTVTKPTDAMRQAMAEAEVGDDVFGEDPTINALQNRVAELLGHEAALFVASGTMANVVCLMTHCSKGDEIVADARSHIFEHEVGAAASLAGALIRPIPTEGGVMSVEQVEAAIRTPDVHHTVTRVIALENTHNFSGGTIQPLPVLEAISALGRARGIVVHVDGARLWNAHAESGVPLSTYGRLFDSGYVALSKGLGGPAGSVIFGSRAFIDRALRFRKMVGGGMRQVGVLAAAGLYAIEHHLERLRDDHENARVFAERCCRIPGVRLAQARVETNIVFLDVGETGWPAAEVETLLLEEGVGVFATAPTVLRALTHLQVGRDDVIQAAESLARIVSRAA
jgi:threonine aldolase